MHGEQGEPIAASQQPFGLRRLQEELGTTRGQCDEGVGLRVLMPQHDINARGLPRQRRRVALGDPIDERRQSLRLAREFGRGDDSHMPPLHHLPAHRGGALLVAKHGGQLRRHRAQHRQRERAPNQHGNHGQPRGTASTLRHLQHAPDRGFTPGHHGRCASITEPDEFGSVTNVCRLPSYSRWSLVSPVVPPSQRRHRRDRDLPQHALRSVARREPQRGQRHIGTKRRLRGYDADAYDAAHIQRRGERYRRERAPITYHTRPFA